MTQVSNETVVIMGGTSGIGLAAGRHLSSMGAKVIVTGRDPARAAKVAEENPTLEAVLVDATSQSQLEKFFGSQNTIDHLVLCVSGSKGAGEFNTIGLPDLRQGFDLKFFAQFQAAQSALPKMRRDGSITFVSAISARAANPGTAGLAAINGAIEAMVKPLARELRPLRVNAVSPGVVETPWWDRLPADVREPLLQRSAAATLVGRNGSAEDLGSAIAFVVTNGFVTGTVLEVDGGLRLN